MGTVQKNHLVRAACSIAAQLPDDQTDALTILRLAAQIIENAGNQAWALPPTLAGDWKGPAAAQGDAPAILIEFPNKASQA